MPEVLVLVKKNRIITHAVAGKKYFQLDSYRCIANKKFTFHYTKLEPGLFPIKENMEILYHVLNWTLHTQHTHNVNL